MTDFSSYTAGWRQRAQIERERIETRRQRALAAALNIARFLGEKFALTKVVGIGSTFDAERFSQRSDIDLVVYDLPSRDYFFASAQIRFMTDFKVDLIPHESANELLKQRILEEGVHLWP
ncbi:MAG: nucleotidyltransferase family protein [bacterium]